jgi:hypothetical protein
MKIFTLPKFNAVRRFEYSTGHIGLKALWGVPVSRSGPVCPGSGEFTSTRGGVKPYIKLTHCLVSSASALPYWRSRTSELYWFGRSKRES